MGLLVDSMSPYRIFISAAEASSDAHGAALVAAMRSQLPQDQELDIIGIGGPKLRAQGLEPIVDARDLLAMGSTEVISRLPRIYRALRMATQEIKKTRPAAVVVMDYGEFHFKLARRLQGESIPLVYYIPPKVWVWRKGRIAKLKKWFSKVLCILPFEEAIFKDAGVSAVYVGNPLADELPFELSKVDARKRIGLDEKDTAFLLMVGSRPAEIQQHVPLMLNAADKLVRRLNRKVKFFLPLPETADLPEVQRMIDACPEAMNLDLKVSQGDAYCVMRAVDAGWIKSGTSTLEAALLNCPHALVYKPSRMTSFIFRYFVRYRGPVGLPNLFLGWKDGDSYLVNELILDRATPELLAQEGYDLLEKTSRREELEAGFKDIQAKVVGQGPSAEAARQVLSFCKKEQN